jgi:HK97 family phage major capsid protein
MRSVRELLQERARLRQQMEDIDRAAGDRSLSVQEQRSWNDADSRIAQIDAELPRAREAEDRDRRAAGSVPTSFDDDSPEARAFGEYLRTGSDQELRALGVATGSAGGFLAPASFRNVVVERLKQYSAVRQVATILPTESGQDLPFPTIDDTANVGAILSENTQVTEQDVTLAQKTLKAYMYTSKLVRVSIQLLEDNQVNLEDRLAGWLGKRLGRATNQHFTTGSGSSQPEGIQTNATVGVTGANGQTTSVIYDDLVDLVGSVDAAYLAEEDAAAWMMHSATLTKIRKLKDSQGHPLLEPDLKRGIPNTLLGYPIVVNPDMPVMAANAKSILFGNFREGFVIRDALGFYLMRLKERYADFLQMGFLLFSRHDSLVQDANAYASYRNSAA